MLSYHVADAPFRHAVRGFVGSLREDVSPVENCHAIAAALALKDLAVDKMGPAALGSFVTLAPGLVTFSGLLVKPQVASTSLHVWLL